MKKFILFAIILSLLIPTITMAGKKYSEEDVLQGILQRLNGEFKEGDINMGGVILDRLMSKEEIEDISSKLIDQIGITGKEIDFYSDDIDITDEEGKYFIKQYSEEFESNHMIVYGYDMDKNMIELTIASYSNQDFTEGETTLFINIIKREQNLNINGIIERIADIFKSYGKPLETTTCIIGTLEGKVSGNELKKDAAKSVRKHKGKIIEEYIDESIVSYTAYTPLIESSIFSGDKKVNLNLAIRYNEYEDKTYIWIGTPIITTGY
jgi:hypothetical protein